MGITIVNKTIVPSNIVVMQLALTSPAGYGRHMNIKPGARVNLDIGEVTISVYCWGSEELPAVKSPSTQSRIISLLAQELRYLHWVCTTLFTALLKAPSSTRVKSSLWDI